MKCRTLLTNWKCVDRKCQGCLTKKNDQVIRETEHNLHGQNQPKLVIMMPMTRIKDAVACSLEPPSCLINQELQDKGNGDRAGYLPRLAIV